MSVHSWWLQVQGGYLRNGRTGDVSDLLAGAFLACVEPAAEWHGVILEMCKTAERRVRLQVCREALRWRHLPCDRRVVIQGSAGHMPSWAYALWSALDPDNQWSRDGRSPVGDPKGSNPTKEAVTDCLLRGSKLLRLSNRQSVMRPNAVRLLADSLASLDLADDASVVAVLVAYEILLHVPAESKALDEPVTYDLSDVEPALAELGIIL